MKIHYFQRYHRKEDVITANTMLLLSRLYQYSPDKFFQFLKTGLFEEEIEPEISFHLQEKHKNSIPDATISQESFKIVVETKITANKFNLDQLKRHLQSFGGEKYKVLLTLARDIMDENTQRNFEQEIIKSDVRHVNLTFMALANIIQDILSERDETMQNILDDYILSCEHEGVIGDTESWKWMWVALARKTFQFNKQNNLYYNVEERSRRQYDYLGLYHQKAVRAVGKVCARFVASCANDIKAENGADLTDERKNKILLAMQENPAIEGRMHRYFFVERFYDTDYQKITPGAPMGGRKFNLTDVLNLSPLPNIEQIAQLLRNKTWG